MHEWPASGGSSSQQTRAAVAGRRLGSQGEGDEQGEGGRCDGGDRAAEGGTSREDQFQPFMMSWRVTTS